MYKLPDKNYVRLPFRHTLARSPDGRKAARVKIRAAGKAAADRPVDRPVDRLEL